MNRITPDWQPHKLLEKDCCEFLDGLGFAHFSTTYHDVLPIELQRLLTRNNDPSSLMVRTRADRSAVHRRIRNLACQYEIKTNGTAHRNMAVEAIQLAHHVMAARLGVRCLYVYRDTRTGREAGFWTDSLPLIREIKVPSGNEGIAGVLAIAFPGVPIRATGSTGGSNDAFCLIEETVVVKLCGWRDLLADWLAMHEAA